MIDQRRLERRDGEAGRYGEEAQRGHEGDWAAAQKHSRDRGDNGRRTSRPPRRLMVSREIKDNAGAEGDGEPRQQAAGADLHCRPRADARWNGKLGLRPKTVPALAQSVDRPGCCAGSHAGPRLAL
jgi:hypothetical protein